MIAVDLDGTLAHYDEWRGEEYIGEPVPAMMKIVMDHIAAGEEVVIFTARADSGEAILYIQEWLKKHGLPDLKITNIKHKAFRLFYDDRAVSVKKNEGIINE